ncbi:MAG: hypothetical protein CFE31_09580 [Rhizobiales bacterium PAR1]|nr:MAG: hypothetical protein CFE31_09580 [Rhizobiales bacterium PAR1]
MSNDVPKMPKMPDLSKLMEKMKGPDLSKFAGLGMPSRNDLVSFSVPKLTPLPSQSELACLALSRQISKFENGLDNEHELGFRLVTAGTGLTFHAESIGAAGGQFVEFLGINQDGEKVSLIQHVSQISVLLCALKKRHEKPIRIGFIYHSEK